METGKGMDERVLCVESGVIYPSPEKAGEAVFASPSSIRKAAGGSVRTCARFHWEFLDAERRRSADLLREKRKGQGHVPYVSVKCLESGVTYPSVTEAARAFHVSATSIVSAARGRTRTSAGMHFAYVDAEKRERIRSEKVDPERRRPISRPVRCLESGKLYPTAGAACWSRGISADDMKNCLTGKQETAGGLHWAIVEEEDRPSLCG